MQARLEWGSHTLTTNCYFRTSLSERIKVKRIDQFTYHGSFISPAELVSNEI